MIQSVFARYSRLDLTEKTDRPVAIAALESRLMSFYHTSSIYGIFRCFRGESLLWQRSSDDKWMEPLIDFKDKVSSWSIERKRVPSWSWMAYGGEIRFGSVCTDGLSWKADFEFYYASSRYILAAPLARISSGCRIALYDDTNCEIRDADEDMVGWIRYDCECEDSIERIGCISLAEGTAGWKEYACVSRDAELLPGSFNYVLLVISAGRRQGEVEAYRRLGVAVIQSTYLWPRGDKVHVY